MRGFRTESFLIKRFAEGWRVHAEGFVFTAKDQVAKEINVVAYGKLRFLTYVRAVFGLRKKARTVRAKYGVRTAKGWVEDFDD